MSEVIPNHPPVPDFQPKAETPQVNYVRSRTVPALMIIAGTLFFIAIAADVHFHGKLAQADGPIAQYVFHNGNNYPLIWISGAISYTGGTDIIVGTALCFLPYLIRKRRWRVIFTVVFGLIGSAILDQGLKDYFAIPRPTVTTYYVFKHSQGLYTFPSGHTLGAAMFVGLFVLGWMRLKAFTARTRFVMAALASLWTLLVAASLLYLGVHYLTDLLAAFGVALAWMGVLRAILPPRAYDQPLPRP